LAEGIVWLPDEAQIKAEEDGFAGNLQVKNNQIIKAGTPVIHLHDPFLESQVKIARAKLEELQSQFRAERETNLVKATIIKEQISVAKFELKHILDKTRSMSITAFKNGKIILPEAEDIPGRFVRHGELLGYILDDKQPTIRMAITQDNIGQLRHGIKDIKIRLANQPNREFLAEIIRQAPEATNRLPSATLATIGGGQIVLDPNNQDELLTLEKIFLIDLRFDPHKTDTPLGVRAYVRINHGGEALAKQWFRRIRQVFLRQFNV
jgi:putative peptide zinc metalloprotease protein